MDRKLKIKVLEHGPDKNSQEERDCAAWLIKNGYAEGTATPSHMHPDRRTLNVVWRGATEKGLNYANSSWVKAFLNNNYTIAIVTGVILLVIGSYFS